MLLRSIYLYPIYIFTFMMIYKPSEIIFTYAKWVYLIPKSLKDIDGLSCISIYIYIYQRLNGKTCILITYILCDSMVLEEPWLSLIWGSQQEALYGVEWSASCPTQNLEDLWIALCLVPTLWPVWLRWPSQELMLPAAQLLGSSELPSFLTRNMCFVKVMVLGEMYSNWIWKTASLTDINLPWFRSSQKVITHQHKHQQHLFIDLLNH
jgi:hypothetical protein